MFCSWFSSPQRDPVFQQDEEVGGHGQPAAAVPRQGGTSGAQLQRLHGHLQEVPAHLPGHLPERYQRAAPCTQGQKTEVIAQDNGKLQVL